MTEAETAAAISLKAPVKKRATNQGENLNNSVKNRIE
jgi:hypothetical protein